MTTITPPPVQPPPVPPPPRHLHRGRWIAAIASGAILAVGLGIGIGVGVTSGNNTSAGKQQASASQPAKPKESTSHTASPSAPPAASAATKAANDRQFADWVASSATDTTGVRSTVSSPLMRAYVDYAATYAQAAAQSGTPLTQEEVTAVPGGYQICGDNGNGGTYCNTISRFTHDAQGRITDVAVNSQPMSGRIATGPPNTGSRLRISHVVSFRPASFNGVVVDFRVRNISSEAFTVGPAFLVYFNPTSGGQLTTEDNNSVIPDTLQPGESAVVSAAFATRILTGQISVRSNDGYLAVLAATNLTRPTQ